MFQKTNLLLFRENKIVSDDVLESGVAVEEEEETGMIVYIDEGIWQDYYLVL